MSGLGHLAIYLGVALLLVLIGNLKGMGWFRRGLDRAANRNTNDLGSAKIIAGFGGDKEVQAFAGRRTFRLTLGIRLLSTVLAGTIVALLFKDIGAEMPLMATGDNAVYVFIGGAVLALLYLMFIWNYALILQDHELHVPRYTGGHRVYDLRKIEHMEQDGAYMLRVWFSEGGKAEILKYVEGRGSLMKALNEYLGQSAAGIGGIRA